MREKHDKKNSKDTGKPKRTRTEKPVRKSSSEPSERTGQKSDKPRPGRSSDSSRDMSQKSGRGFTKERSEAFEKIKSRSGKPRSAGAANDRNDRRSDSQRPSSRDPRDSSPNERSGSDRPYRKERSDFGGDKRGKTDRPFRKERGEGYDDRRSGSDKSYTRTRGGSKTAKTTEQKDGTIRLNRYIANSGMCSRREADDLIKTGVVKVNGKIAKEMGTKVNPGDRVEVGGQSINPERKVYILLNKPKDYVTTTDDPHERKTVMELIKHACTERVYPVGRLDRQTTGVLLFTNDGDLAKQLTHPKYNKKKIYHVHLDKVLKKSDMLAINEGIELEDGLINADTISYVDMADKKQVGIELHSGKNRIVRRIFEHLGYNIKKLDRVYFAGLTKKNLTRGKWRFLTEAEIRILKAGSYR